MTVGPRHLDREARRELKTITLDDPRYPGTYVVEEQEQGRLVLEPVIGPSTEELVERGGGRRLSGEQLEKLFGNLRAGAGRGTALGEGAAISTRFDDEAFWLDVRRHKPGSRAAHTAQTARRELERAGLSLAKLHAYPADGRDWRGLAGLLKVYLPLKVAGAKRQPFAMVLTPTLERGELVLRYTAFGARHRQPGSRAPSVDEIVLAWQDGSSP